jgi:hypothetical protein
MSVADTAKRILYKTRDKKDSYGKNEINKETEKEGEI